MNRINIGRTLLASALAGIVCPAFAVTYYVSPTGDDGNDGLSWATAMKSPELVPAKMIAASADKPSVSGHTLVISNGHYRLSSAIRLADADGYTTGEIHIRSVTGNPADVVLDGQGSCQGIYIYGGWNSTIEGVTVTNCAATDVHGGGILLRSTRGSVTDCIVRDCHLTVGSTARYGGGIYAYLSTVSGCTVENCSIVNAASATGKNSSGGGIFGYRCMVTNCVVRNCAIRMNSGACSPTGGGIWIGDEGGTYSATYPKQGVFDTEVSGCVIEMPYASGGKGAGMFVMCGLPDEGDGVTRQAYVEDCLVHDCTNHFGAAIYLDKHVDISNTTSSNNWDVATTATSDNSTGLHLGPRCHATGCLIAFNTGNSGGTVDEGSPAVLMNGDDASLVDSAVIGNESMAKAGVAFKASAVSKMLVSNCVFRANRLTSASRGGLIHAANLAEGTDIEIVDCQFTDNDMSSCKWGGWVRAMDNTAGRHWALRFRNCLCADNSFGSIGAASAYTFGGAQTDSKLELSFENCTIANNTLASGCYMIHGYEEKTWDYASPSNIFVRACVVVNNDGGAGQIYTRTYTSTTNVNYSVFTQRGTDLCDPRQVGNKFYDSAKPLFVDAVNHDYRLARGSQATDMAPLLPWMGDGGRNVPLDLGSGLTVAKTGKFGVSILRSDAVPRVMGKAIDAGCFEFDPADGTVVVFR